MNKKTLWKKTIDRIKKSGYNYKQIADMGAYRIWYGYNGKPYEPKIETLEKINAWMDENPPVKLKRGRKPKEIK